MDNGNKVAVFDFCETLIGFQTADAFINFVYEKTGSRRMRRIEKLKQLFYKAGLPRLIENLSGLWEKKSLNKRWRLYEFSGMDESQLDELSLDFYRERLRPAIIQPVLSELIDLRKSGYTTGIVSGGFAIYIRHFVAEYGIDFCISNDIVFKNGKCRGRLAAPDCMGMQKLAEIKKLYPDPPQASVSYSDSISDLPILQWASRGVVVSKGRHQEWVDDYKFKEIIWQQD